MKLYTRKEAAQVMKIGLRTLDRWLVSGQLACFRLGKGPKAPVRIAEEHIVAFLQSCATQDKERIRAQVRSIIAS